MSPAPDRLAGVRVLDPAVAALADAPLRLAAGCEWPAALDPAQLWLLPGLHDLSTRLGEPGPPHPAGLGSELRAARRGGFDTVLLNPDTDPVIDSAATIEWIERRAASANGARLRLLGALTAGLEGRSLANMDGLRRSGVAGLGQGLRQMPPADVLLNALRYAAGLDMTVHLHPRDAALHQGLVGAGAAASDLGLPGIPAAAETAAIGTLLALVEETGCHVHIGRVSTAAGVAWIRWGKQRQLPISADTSLAHLLLAAAEPGARGDFGRGRHLDPPLRGAADRQALREGVADGTLDAICCDHRPHPADAYLQPLAGVPAGAAGYDSFLPLLLQDPALDALPLERRLSATCHAPAAIMGIRPEEPPMGVLYHPESAWQYAAQTRVSATSNSPWWGATLRGRPIGVIIGGECTIFATP